MQNQSWGATPLEWATFAFSLSLMRYMVPIVSNRTTPSYADENGDKPGWFGKAPSIVDEHGKATLMKGWGMLTPSSSDVSDWSSKGYGFGIKCDLVRSVDIDIDDPTAAKHFRDIVTSVLGELPVRSRDNSGRCMLVFKYEQPDLRVHRWQTEHGMVELLATGQQFVAAGTHKSGSRYDWEGGLPTRIPTIDKIKFDELVAALSAESISTAIGNESRPALAPRKSLGEDDPVTQYLKDKGLIVRKGRNGLVHVKCPWEHEHTSKSGDSATSWLPPGVGGHENGHFVCKHATCEANHRDTTSFLREIGYIATDFDVMPMPDALSSFSVDFRRLRGTLSDDARSVIPATAETLQIAVNATSETGWDFVYDKFRDVILTKEPSYEFWQVLQDVHYTRFHITLDKAGFKYRSNDLVIRAIEECAVSKQIDSAIERLTMIEPHDGVSRIDTFAADCFGTPNDEYHKLVSRYLWTALVGRLLTPGVKADMMVVLIGNQGIGKSTAIKELCIDSSWFRELNLNDKSDDLIRKMGGCAMGEISELNGMSNRDVEHVKAFLSCTADTVVPKYKNLPATRPRRTVLLGTTNQTEFLSDVTGNRRFLPVEVEYVRIDLIREMLSQLYAEAIAMYNSSGVMYHIPSQLLQAHQASHIIENHMVEPINDWLNTLNAAGVLNKDDLAYPLTGSRVLEHALNIPVSQRNLLKLKEVARAMKYLGYESGSFRHNGKVVKAYHKL